MPVQNRPVEPSAFHDLKARVEGLESEQKRQGRQLVTVDRIVTANLPAPSEGQIAVEASGNALKYYANQQWRTLRGGLPSAMLLEGQNSRASGVLLNMTYGSFYRNDTSFSYSDVTGGKAQYMTLSEEGLYRGEFIFHWDTDWTAGDYPFMEPAAKQGGANTALTSTISIYSEDTDLYIGAEQITAAEMDHHLIKATVYWVFTVANFGESTMAVGCNLRATNSRTKNFGSSVTVVRLGDALSQVTIT